MESPRIAFFGTPDIAVNILSALEARGFLPMLVITNPDAPVGRKQILTPSPVKQWALKRGIEVRTPTSLTKDESTALRMKELGIDLSIVAAYGKLIPKSILEIPSHGTVNVHPSLLPRLRGASPIRSAILNDQRETGVTIMLLDEELDHGPLIAQQHISIEKDTWPLRGRELDQLLSTEGGVLLAETLPRWLGGEITPIPQEHDAATFCTKITKEMGELDLTADPYQNLLKIRAFDGWPGTFFYVEKDGIRMRVKIIDAQLAPDGSLEILRVIPEGKREMDFAAFRSAFQM